MKYINFNVSETELYNEGTQVIKAEHLPSYVDDVIEGYYYNGKFYKESTHTTEIKGETGKIYIDITSTPNKSYRWVSSTQEFVLVGSGEAEWGNIRGTLSNQNDLNSALAAKTDASVFNAHASDASNPHSVNKEQVGLGNVDNTSDIDKPVSTATQNALNLKANDSSVVKTVNGVLPSNGNVDVKAFMGIDSWFSYSEYVNVTTATFCNTLKKKIDEKFGVYQENQCGLAFMLKGAVFTDFPKSFMNDYDIATGELFIYVLASGLFTIEMSTTNNFCKKGDEGQADPRDAGKYMSIYDYGYQYNDHMRMLWNAYLMCPQSDTPLEDGSYVYIPTQSYHSVSKYWLDHELKKTVTGVRMNDASVSDGGVADLGNVVKTINGVAPINGNSVVKTFSSVPESMDAYKGGTTVEFCNKFEEIVNPDGGTAFLTDGISFTDMPFVGNAEMIIYVPSSGIYVLEISSCNAFDSLGSAGKWLTIYWGEMCMPWQGYMTCPKDSSGNYVPAKDSDGVSLYYLKQFAIKNGLSMPD